METVAEETVEGMAEAPKVEATVAVTVGPWAA